MSMPREHEWWGTEFDWLGVDRGGHVAVFTTAGYGPLPAEVDEHLADVDAAADRLEQLPVIGSAHNVVQRFASDWRAYSARGFYTYDWHVWDGPYQRVSSPSVPVSISQLPADIQAVARFAVFPVDFADEPAITIEHGQPLGH